MHAPPAYRRELAFSGTAAVTGGTREFAGARGTLCSRGAYLKETGSRDDLLQGSRQVLSQPLLAAALSTPTFLLAWAIDTAAAILVFLHATRRGSRHATAWGIGVFLALAFALPAYLVHNHSAQAVESALLS